MPAPTLLTGIAVFNETGYIDKERTKRRGVGVGMGWYRTSIGIGS